MKQTSGEFTLPDEQGDFGDWSHAQETVKEEPLRT